MNKRMKQLAALLAVVVLVFASMNVSAFAAGEMANVTVVKNEEYIPYIYNEDIDSQLCTFVPVGETVQIPVGTELILAYAPSGGDVAEVTFEVTNSKTGKTNTYHAYTAFNVEAGNNTIKLIAKQYSDNDSEDYSFNYADYKPLNDWNQVGVNQKAQLELWNSGGKKLEAKNWRFYIASSEFDYEHDNALFNLTSEGVLTAKEPLKPGRYYVRVEADYDGATYDLVIPLVTATQLDYYVVLSTWAFEDGGDTLLNGWPVQNENWYGMDATVSEAIAKDKPMELLRKEYAMYGGYTLQEKFYDIEGNPVDANDNRLIDNVRELYVFFVKNGEKYCANGSIPGAAGAAPAAPAAPAEQVTTKAPRTGDNTPLALYLCLMVAGIVGIMVIRKRRA